jgi:hypothetical protein
MLWIVFYLIVLPIVRAMVRTCRRLRASRPLGMCAGCQFAHMQYGTAGRNAVFCTYGGGVRPVQVEVLYCTDYIDRNMAVRPAQIGFVPGIDSVAGR